jgi:hypothetical protein
VPFVGEMHTPLMHSSPDAHAKPGDLRHLPATSVALPGHSQLLVVKSHTAGAGQVQVMAPAAAEVDPPPHGVQGGPPPEAP